MQGLLVVKLMVRVLKWIDKGQKRIGLNYLFQIKMFDDRLVVESPGTLPGLD